MRLIPRSFRSDAYSQLLVLLREARQKRGVTQRSLSRLLGAHHTLVNLTEAGDRQLNVVELRAWCQALGIDFVAFVAQLDQKLTAMENENMGQENAVENKKVEESGASET